MNVNFRRWEEEEEKEEEEEEEGWVFSCINISLFRS